MEVRKLRRPQWLKSEKTIMDECYTRWSSSRKARFSRNIPANSLQTSSQTASRRNVTRRASTMTTW